MASFLLPGLLTLLSLCPIKFTEATSAADWRGRTIYQVITDRYAVESCSDIPTTCLQGDYSQRCGGSWKALKDNLDYIQGMGFTAIWISPIVKNRNISTAYHGYWTQDPAAINSYMGTDQELQDLTAALHLRNMLIMVDFNVNDLSIPTGGDGNDATYSSLPSPWNQAIAFHQPPCNITYSDQTSVEQCWFSTSGAGSLPDIKTEVSTYFDPIVADVQAHVNHFAIDGIRLDVARLLNKAQLGAFQTAVGCFVTGMIADGDITYVNPYQSSTILNSYLNYPKYYSYQDAFDYGHTMQNPAYQIGVAADNAYDETVLTNFIDNHDEPRFASYPGSNVAKEMNAVTLLLFDLGLPIVYYGWEQRFTGASDPNNREPLWLSKYDQTSALYKFIAKLHTIRNMIAAFDNTFYSTSGLKSKINDDHVLHLQRGAVYIIVNNVGSSGTAPSNQDVPANGVFEHHVGVNAVDLVTCQTVTLVNDDGSFSNPTPTTSDNLPRIWIKQYDDSKICGGSYSDPVVKTLPAPLNCTLPINNSTTNSTTNSTSSYSSTSFSGSSSVPSATPSPSSNSTASTTFSGSSSIGGTSNVTSSSGTGYSGTTSSGPSSSGPSSSGPSSSGPSSSGPSSSGPSSSGPSTSGPSSSGPSSSGPSSSGSSSIPASITSSPTLGAGPSGSNTPDIITCDPSHTFVCSSCSAGLVECSSRAGHAEL